MAVKKKEFKIPKSLALCVDKLYEVREKRLSLGRQMRDLEEIESKLKSHIIDKLPEQKASGISGKLCRVTMVHKDVPYAKDWQSVYKHITETGHFDLLGRRLNSNAVQERWDNGEEIPGVETYKTTSLSINKI